jgi:hypothetical protein
MRQPVTLNRFEQRAENCEQRAIQSADPLVAELLFELAKDFRRRADAHFDFSARLWTAIKDQESQVRRE